jgi:hypothetical protein
MGSLVYMIPVSGSPGAPDQGLPTGGLPSHPIAPGGGSPSHPIQLPPLPPGTPSHPIALPPPGVWPPEFPVQIPGTPEHPITMPPGSIWPPLPPDSGISGVTLILIFVIGVGHRWLVVQGPTTWPPQPGPK